LFTTIEVILKFSLLIITHHFLMAGMGDALATWLEARTSVAGKIKNMWVAAVHCLH
jgi:glycerol dehydrogenase-like iron-containing ADH family enzyme